MQTATGGGGSGKMYFSCGTEKLEDCGRPSSELPASGSQYKRGFCRPHPEPAVIDPIADVPHTYHSRTYELVLQEGVVLFLLSRKWEEAVCGMKPSSPSPNLAWLPTCSRRGMTRSDWGSGDDVFGGEK